MTQKDCGEFIAQLRKEVNLTQKQLAEKINVTDKAISRWETGKGYPDLNSLLALSEIFNVSVNELLAGKRISNENVKEVADKNIISVINESKKIRFIRFKSFITFIITHISLCILCFAVSSILMKPGSAPITAIISSSIICIFTSSAGILLVRYQHKKVWLTFCFTIMLAWLLVPYFYLAFLYLFENIIPLAFLEVISTVIIIIGFPGEMFHSVISGHLNSNSLFLLFLVAVICAIIPTLVTYFVYKTKKIHRLID